MLFTVKANVVESCKFGVSLSFTVMVISVIPKASATGVIEATQFGIVPLIKICDAGTTAETELVTEIFNAVQVSKLSTSETVKKTSISVSSLIAKSARSVITGASFIGFTVRSNTSLLIDAPSLTVKVKVDKP